MKQFIISVLLLILIVSIDLQAQTRRQANVLPLNNGWYQYDFSRTFKSVEDEHNFYISTGMRMTQELTWKYTGVIAFYENGILFDPVTGIELLINKEGQISCASNYSIRGTVNRNGGFSWSGLVEEHGRLNSVFVKGTLSAIPITARGGKEFDGVYHLTDTGTGRQQLARISGGFYTWTYIDNMEAGFTPWPTLIKTDGTFSFSMDLTTYIDIASFQSTNFTTGFLTQGKVIPGQGISIEEISRTAGLGNDTAGPPQIYSGMIIRAGQFPNEAIPDSIETNIQKGRSSSRTNPVPNRVSYPSWYIDLPRKTGFLYAAGEKIFEVSETAFTMAEAAAAADLADQIITRIISEATDISANTAQTIDDKIRAEALHRLNYKIINRHYNNNTKTAFVLIEMKIE